MLEKSPEAFDQQINDMESVSRAFIDDLERAYLDERLEQSRVIQPSPYIDPPWIETHFLKITQVGEPFENSQCDPFTALQTLLAACHNPGKHRLLFLVKNDGKRNEIYLGISTIDTVSSSFVTNIGSFLQSNWHGIRYELLEAKDVLFPRLNGCASLTGIPSLKAGDVHGYPQGLDRILHGLQGRPFAYLVIADPMPDKDVLDIVQHGRYWNGHLHSMARITRNQAFTQITSGNTNRTQGTSNATSTSRGSSVSATREVSASLGIQVPLSNIAKFSLGGQAKGTASTSSSTNVSCTSTGTKSYSHSEGFQTSLTHNLGSEYVNPYAQAAIQQIEQHIGRFENTRASGCWNVGIYFFASSQDEASNGATCLRALLSGPASVLEPIRIHDLRFAWKKGVEERLKNFEQPRFALIDPQTEHPLGKAFSGLTTPLNTEELALLVNLPRREIPGVQVVPVANFSLNPPRPEEKNVILGHVLQGGEQTLLKYPLSVATLAKHTLVTGISGSGKSTTCRCILQGLLEHEIPFLVIEPAKDEYLSWAMQVNEERKVTQKRPIAIYAPGLQTWHGQPLKTELTLNPFDVIRPDDGSMPNVLSHIDRLKSILVATFPMLESLPILLEDTLFHAYTKPCNWLGSTLPEYGTHFPTLEQLVNQIPAVVKSKGYEERVASNLTAALTTRVQSLRLGWKRTLFDRPVSTPWHELFAYPTVINISSLGDDADKAFAMAIILQFLYEYRQIKHEQNSSDPDLLQHLLVIEESHRILQCSAFASTASANPQAKMAEMFTNNLVELRAYGQGFMVVDQVPAKLIPDVMKNTNLKIVHRLVAGDDREVMAQSMSLTESQKKIINRLRPGQTIVHSDLDDMAFWIQVMPKYL